MPKRITTNHLAAEIHELKQDLGTFKKEVTEQLQPFHDYIVGQNAIAENSRKKNTGINVSKDIIQILLYLALAIVIALGGSDLL